MRQAQCLILSFSDKTNCLGNRQGSPDDSLYIMGDKYENLVSETVNYRELGGDDIVSRWGLA